MAKQTRRAAKQRKIPSSKGDDRLLRFVRQHSFGVALLALLSAGGGWLVWHCRDCMTDQKTQLAATRKAWTTFRTSHQKFGDDVDALLTRIDMFKPHREIGYASYEEVNQYREALFELGQIVNTD